MNAAASLSDALLPQITSLLPGSIVHTRLLLVHGFVQSVAHGTLHITPQGSPALQVSIVSGTFKALVPLQPGDNAIRLAYETHCSEYPVRYEPLATPPLKLVIIAGKDSPLLYDDVPNPREPNTVETAIKKLRLAGYLWSAYTANESFNAGFGHRTFRLDETETQDSLSRQSSAVQNTAHVRVLRSNYTVAEIRDPQRAQQNKEAGSAGSLFDIALQTLAAHPETHGPREYIAALMLDAHYETATKLIVGHAALGGGTPQTSLAIFGSHSLFAWPSCLEDIERCFTDTREVDTRYCGVDAEGKRYYSACNVGIGAMMHECGHLFGCPHQASGVMLRDYPRLHRSFTAVEPSPATQEVGDGSCHWHLLDLLRFAGHPSFTLPEDDAIQGEMTAMPCPAGLYVEAQNGLRFIELYTGDGDFPAGQMLFEHSKHNKQTSTQQLILTEAQCRQHLHTTSGKLKVSLFSRTNQNAVIDDLAAALQPEQAAGIGDIYRSSTCGYYPGQDGQILLDAPISRIVVFAGACLDGIEFHAAGSRPSIQLLGKRGGARHVFDLMPGEHITGFHVRSGAWIDGLAVTTNQRQLPMCGNLNGGSLHTLRTPPGMRCCGVFGRVQEWITQIGMLYTAT